MKYWLLLAVWNFVALLAQGQKNYKPNLYIIAIGVSEYKNYPLAKLKYAHKDAGDLVKAFKATTIFNNVNAFLLTNELARRDTILKLKKELMKSEVDDYVILSYSGHGILNKALDFYFCTNDIDLHNLNKTAVTFEEMETLLDSIPSRRKILLIDACYSGEVDKDAMKKVIGKTDLSKALTIGNAKPFSPGNEFKIYQQTTFELMKELFVDLRRRTGATIISSSSGVELSYEKDKWSNGLFTYAILSALTNPSTADANGDGVFISELIAYATNIVKTISKGYQVPTTREENIEFDYRVW